MGASRLARFAAAMCLAGWLANCSPSPAEPPPDADAAAEIGAPETLPRTLPPPSESMPRYVGLWAVAAEDCADPPWRFEADGVATQGEVSCRFDTTRLTPAGYEIDAACTAQAPPGLYRIQISFAESARAMMLSGGPWSGPLALAYCGPLPGE